jgi:hypothetical protein
VTDLQFNDGPTWTSAISAVMGDRIELRDPRLVELVQLYPANEAVAALTSDRPHTRAMAAPQCLQMPIPVMQRPGGGT